MSRRLALAAVAAAGCYSPTFPEGLECSESNRCPEGQACDLGTGRCFGADASACPGDALPFTPRNLDPCTIPVALGDLTFPAGTVEIDTTAGVVRGPGGMALDGFGAGLVLQTDGGSRAFVISARDLAVPMGTTLVVSGDWPLALVAFGTLQVDGVVDASGSGSISGPGADRACAIGTGAAGVTRDVPVDSGGSGGGGSAYGGAGGDAGDVAPQPSPPSLVLGGTPWGEPTGPLLGGCRGGAGGIGFSGDPLPPGGGGGGAVELVGGTAIAISGVVSVSGGGGAGGIGGVDGESSGGGGGGSGGKLVLQTRALTITGGALTAAGGGGGEGRFENLAAGNAGADGALDTAVPAPGGSGAGMGGDGGAGAVVDAGQPGRLGTGAADMPAGGGGGGGGVGRILIDAGTRMFTGELIVPMPVVL